MIFRSAMSKVNQYILFGAIIFMFLMTIPILFEDSIEPFIVVFGINLIITIFFLWTYKSTFYILKSDVLIWKFGPFKGTIEIKNINKIEHHKGIIVPTIWKPALSHIGLIITYNKYDDIYISPENSEEFITKLLETNSNITIKNNPYVL